MCLNINFDKKNELFVDKYDFLYKHKTFYISDLNYYNFMKIMKIKDIDEYNRLLADNSENIKNGIVYLCLFFENNIDGFIKEMNNISLDDLNYYGEHFYKLMNNIQNNNLLDNIYKIYIESNDMIDYEYFFNRYPKAKILLKYENQMLYYIDRNGNVLKSEKITKEQSLNRYKKLNKNNKLLKKDRYLNNLIIKILEEFLSASVFFENFKDEILSTLVKLISFEHIEIFEETQDKIEFIFEDFDLDNIINSIKENKKENKKEKGVKL